MENNEATLQQKIRKFRTRLPAGSLQGMTTACVRSVFEVKHVSTRVHPSGLRRLLVFFCHPTEPWWIARSPGEDVCILFSNTVDPCMPPLLSVDRWDFRDIDILFLFYLFRSFSHHILDMRMSGVSWNNHSKTLDDWIWQCVQDFRRLNMAVCSGL